MALTAAERMKKYRERLKNNPAKFEELRKKHIDRMKIKKKKINEMSAEEKAEQRKLWQKYKKKERQSKSERKEDNNNKEKTDINSTKKTDKKKLGNKKDDNTEKETKENSGVFYKSKLKYLKRKCIVLNKKCSRLESRVQKLATNNETIKKRYFRSQIYFKAQISELQGQIDKMKAREEVMECTLKRTYQNCEKQTQKRLMKNVVKNAQKNKTFVAKLLGLSAQARTKVQKKKVNIIPEIENFYKRDDVSRCTAGKRECRTKNKIKQQIRYLLDTQQNLYTKYKDEGGKYKFSTFCKHRPFYVISPHLGSRNTCLCVKHSNIELAFIALKKSGVLLQNNIKEVLTNVACDIKCQSCMYGNCQNCKSYTIQYNSDKDNDEISWQQWERVDHTYKKENQEKTTKKTVQNTKNGTVKDLMAQFKTILNPFKKHFFNMNHQQKQYQIAVKGLKENEALIICDFSENYETKMSSEIQSMHFGASKGQVSLHTGMIYWHNKCQSFCTVSPNTLHKPAAIWAHLTPILKIVKEESPAVSVVHFFTDGPTSQYRQKHNFFLHNIFTKDLGLTYSTWSFFEAGHGKGVADGIGGTVKRILDKQVCFGRNITSAQDAFEILTDTMKVVKIFYIPDQDIDKITAMLPSNVLPLKGTFEVHQTVVDAEDKSVVKHRKISCFCGESRGLCLCFSIQTHFLEVLTPEISRETPNNFVKDVALFPEMFLEDLTDAVTDEDIQMVGDTIDLILENNSETSGVINLNDAVAFEEGSPPTKKTKVSLEKNRPSNWSENAGQDPFIIMPNSSHSTPIRTPSTSNKSKSNLSMQERDPLGSLNTMKIRKPTKQGKSLKTVVKRKFKCDKCNGPIVMNRISKCMSCQKWFCFKCSDGQIIIDYICDICLGAEDSDDD